MKTRFPLLSIALAGWLAVTAGVALRAQDPAPDTQDKAPAAAPEAPAAAPATTATEVVLEPEAQVAPPAPAAPAESPTVAATEPDKAWISRGEVVAFNNNIIIRENERASKAVAICGNVEVRGRVDHDVVAIMGDVFVDGPVGKVVAVMGKVTLGPNAKVSGELVSVGGGVDNPNAAPIHGNLVNVAPFLPRVGPLLNWLGDAVPNVRLLSPRIAWPWYVFGTGVLFCLLLAAAFGRGVNACAQSLEDRPGATLTTALALLPLLPVFTLLLICTGIGILLLPFLAVAVVFAFAFGKAAVLVFLGRCVLRPCGSAGAVERAWLTVLVGAAVLAMLYCVPWLGLLVWALTTWVGLGMVVATILEKRRREKAAAAAAAPKVPGAPVVARSVSPDAAAAGVTPVVAAVAPPPESVAEPVAAPTAEIGATAPAVPPVMASPTRAGEAVSAVTLPRGEFWVRLGALLLDIILVAVAGTVGMVLALLPFPLLFGGYMFGFWLWKGTTIGGIVFNLKVVRLDGRPVDGATAAVRTLMAFISAVTLLGFLWCLWDDERQTWHDKVAGTVVVRVPKATPLV